MKAGESMDDDGDEDTDTYITFTAERTYSLHVGALRQKTEVTRRTRTGR